MSFASLFLRVNEVGAAAMPARPDPVGETQVAVAGNDLADDGTQFPGTDVGLQGPLKDWKLADEAAVKARLSSIKGRIALASVPEIKGQKAAPKDAANSCRDESRTAKDDIVPITISPPVLPNTELRLPTPSQESTRISADASDEADCQTQASSTGVQSRSSLRLAIQAGSHSTPNDPAQPQDNGVSGVPWLSNVTTEPAANAGAVPPVSEQTAASSNALDAVGIPSPQFAGVQRAMAAAGLVSTKQTPSATGPMPLRRGEDSSTRSAKPVQAREKSDEKSNQAGVTEPGLAEDVSPQVTPNRGVKAVAKAESNAKAVISGGETPTEAAAMVTASTHPGANTAAPRHTPAVLSSPAESLWEPTPEVKPSHIDPNPANAELHVNLRTEELGRVEIHTTVRDSHVTTSVAVEESAAKSAVVSEFSRLHAVLGAHDLQLDAATVTVVGEGRQGAMEFGGGSQHERHPSPHHGSANPLAQPREVEIEDGSETGNLNILV